MRNTIYKYQITGKQDEAGCYPVLMRRGADILNCQVQGDIVCLWAAVDPNNEEVVTRTFAIVPTGKPASFPVNKRNHIATILTPSGAIVLHIFEVPDHLILKMRTKIAIN